MHVGTSFDCRDDWDAYVGYVFQNLNTFIVNLGLQSLGTELIHASHLRVTLSAVDLSHRSYLQFTGILLSGHQHGSPPFNVAGPLISCLTFGVHSRLPPSPATPSPKPARPTWRGHNFETGHFTCYKKRTF